MARFLMLLLILAAIMPGGAFLELPFMQGLSTFGSKVHSHGLIGTGLTSLRASISASGASGKASKIQGKWKKVKEVNQEEAMLKLGLALPFRKAAGLLTRLELRANDKFEIVTKGALVVQITEKYGFDGSTSTHSRRDKRWGKATGKIVSSSDSKVRLDIAWPDPHGGVLEEVFEVDSSGKTLTHTSKIKVNEDATTQKKGEWYTYYSVYTRE